MDRKPIFDAVRIMLGRGFTDSEIVDLDLAIDTALEPSAARKRSTSYKGIQLIKRFEGCARKRADGLIEAYPDPGSADGKPWTIGWGSTGPDIGPDTVWTQAECDARFERELEHYEREVADAIGDAPTTQSQFDALVSFHYNTGAIRRATLTKLHNRGKFSSVVKEFHRWIYNDGKVLKGLKNRRQAEAALYASNVQKSQKMAEFRHSS